MFILNKKNGNIQECHNADAINVCRKDTDHYVVAATMEELEGKAANRPQDGPKKPEAKIPKNPEKPLMGPLRSSERAKKRSRQPEGALKAVRGSRNPEEALKAVKGSRKDPGRKLVPERISPAREERIL